MQINIKGQQGEFNLALAGTIAALVIAIGAFLYANEVSQRVAAQQAAIAQLQASAATQQEQVNQATGDMSELQSSINLQASRLDALEKELHAMKEEARKRAEKAKAAAKAPVKSTKKAAAKPVAKKKK
jgi:hypothetical protein